MDRLDAAKLLDRIGVLRSRCDVDLLVFFARHPSALLTSEQIAAWLGYELKHVAGSLDVLIEAGMVTRTQNPTHAARMYSFGVGPDGDRWLPTLLEQAKSRKGRLALMQALAHRAPKGPEGSTSTRARDVANGQRAPTLSIVGASEPVSKIKSA